MKSNPLFLARSTVLRPAALGALLVIAAISRGTAQEAPIDPGEEIVVLSPFCVSSDYDRGYSYSAPRPAPIAQPNFGGRNGATSTGAPITIIRKADAVVIEFALSNSADKQDQRNRALTDSADALAKAITAAPGLRFENREVQLMSGNRSRSILGKGGVVTSFANFAVFAELSDGVRLYDRVKQVRDMVSAAKLVGDTKVIDGPVALYLKRPNDLRKELLAKIFEDYEVMRKGLGAEFEVQMSGLNGPVQLRSCSEREIELWIDYSFAIKSVRELELHKPVVVVK